MTPSEDEENEMFEYVDEYEGMEFMSFDAIGECQGCGVVGNVNGLQFCEWCMDEMEE